MAMRQIFKKLLKNIRPVTYTSGILFAHCVSSDKPNENAKLKLELLDIKKLTYEHMIRQSALDVTNSATQALTIIYMAITYQSVEYRTLLNKLISLHEETLNYNVSDAHWDAIVKARNQMQFKKEIIMNLIGYMDYVHKMAEAASTLSYLTGLDNISSTLQQRIDDALKKVKVEIDSNTELEREYLRIQEQCIKDSKKTKK